MEPTGSVTVTPKNALVRCNAISPVKKPSESSLRSLGTFVQKLLRSIYVEHKHCPHLDQQQFTVRDRCASDRDRCTGTTVNREQKARAEVAATLDASVARQNALSQEHRAEIEEINKQNLVKMAAVSKDHHYEMENLRAVLSIADQDLHEALKAASKATQ